MPFNWTGAWKVYFKVVTGGTTIGLSDKTAERTKFRIKKNPHAPKWTLVEVQHLEWLPRGQEFTLTPDDDEDPKQFTGQVTIDDGGKKPHDIWIDRFPAADPTDDEIKVRVREANGTGPIGQGTGNAGRG